MQIVIDIQDDVYKGSLVYKDVQLEGTIANDLGELTIAVANGIPLPKGHGRLKDVDALIDSLGASDRDIYCKSVIEEDAPTIIEADTESEET